ncbi:molecular chaperone [Calothrix sp. UHCC 0171]|uniref:fimbrial biogenesis chaperone n=1 Tax=Calothrix sp. UHCC 0171 TaxID=3110245 RepID=UPI002B1F045F|nr:molecular chaperone [Calothrix sp. UHCC 0171]MEA5573894.1 molecular chaperone [Calothrix sp. UHCC 0171]
MLENLQKISASVLALGTFITAFQLPASAISIGVSPPRFELKLDDKRPTTEVFRVVNIGSKPATFRIYIQDWTLDEQNKVQPLPPSEQSLGKWIVVNPGKFTIPPGKSQTVRFSIRPRIKPQLGEHRTLIYVEEVPNENSDKAPTPVRVVGRYGVGVYAYVGNIKKVGVINAIAVDTKNAPVKATFDISSQGTAHVRMSGQYAIWQANKYPGASKTEQISDAGKGKPKLPDGVVAIGSLPSSPVLPDTRRQLVLNISQQLAPGNYVLDLNGELSGTQIDRGINFTVPARMNSNPPSRSSSSLKNQLRSR